MKVLVAYASTHGSTAEIAEAIADALSGDAVVVTVRVAANVRSIAGFDAFVIGSAVYFGRWLPAARALAQRCEGEAPFVPLWRFSSGPLTEAQPRPARLSVATAEPRRHADRTVVFGGRLSHIGLDATERSLVTLARLQAADYRHWDDIRDWALRIGAELADAAPRTELAQRIVAQ
ncbi:MAG: protoporphyrinogen oxidase [Frankiales bacterium]|nr:protoporphyrinogen oxidase [Frankiales bacterium]